MATPAEVAPVQPTAPPDELERHRELARARQQRRRDRLRAAPAAGQAASPGAQAAAGAEWASRSSATVHETRPLEGFGGAPETFNRVPPLVENVEPPKPVDPAAANKVAAVVALMAKVTLDDLAKRVDLQATLAGQGLAVDVDEVKGAVLQYVHGCAHRTAIKYGINITIPYEDELVTGVAVLGSAGYLWMRLSGKLERRPEGAHRVDAAPSSSGSSSSTADAADGLDDEAGPYQTLKIRRTA